METKIWEGYDKNVNDSDKEKGMKINMAKKKA